MTRIYRQTIKKKKKEEVKNPENHDYDVFIHLEPDNLEYEVMWALGNITMNKVEFPAELFQILKDDAVEVLHSIC